MASKIFALLAVVAALAHASPMPAPAPVADPQDVSLHQYLYAGHALSQQTRPASVSSTNWDQNGATAGSGSLGMDATNTNFRMV
jgi:hypothetical protein